MANLSPGAAAPDPRLANVDAIHGRNTIMFRRFRRNRAAMAGLAIFLALTVFALVGGIFTPWDRETIDPFNIGQPPSGTHYLGTSQAGIDLYAMTVEGTRTSLLVGLAVGLGSVFIAAAYGCTMAYFGGKVDKTMLFVLESLIMMPALLVVAVATSGAGDGLRRDLPSWLLLVIVLLFFSWMGTARLIRSLSMAVIQQDFVKAARYMGVPPRRIVWQHLVPNIGSLLVLDATRGVTAAILAEVAFSFIGIGIRVPEVSLGVLIGGATAQVLSYPWMFWVPLTVMFLLTGSLALMNDGLRDAFDPASGANPRPAKSSPDQPATRTSA